MDDARSLSTIEAPRQKLMKESATVVATTTLGAANADVSRPSCEDILYVILRLFQTAAPHGRRGAYRHAVPYCAIEPLVIRDEAVHGLPQQLVRASVCASRQVAQLRFGFGRKVQLHNQNCTASGRPNAAPDGARTSHATPIRVSNIYPPRTSKQTPTGASKRWALDGRWCGAMCRSTQLPSGAIIRAVLLDLDCTCVCSDQDLCPFLALFVGKHPLGVGVIMMSRKLGRLRDIGDV